MKNDMDLIMESWRSQIILESPQTPSTVGEFRIAWLMTTGGSMDVAGLEKAQKMVKKEEEFVKLYQKVNNARPSRKNIKNGMALISVLTAATAMFAVPDQAPTIATTMAGGASTLSAASAWVADFLENREEKKLQDKKVTKVILSILGIDEKLLDTIENDIEDDFYMEKVEPDFKRWVNNASANEPMPNYGVMFKRFLNRNQKSPLSSSTSSKIVDK